jgi:hypothetical protein
MKTLTILLLGALFAFLLFSCSARSNNSTQTTTAATTTSSPSNEAGLQFKSPKITLDFSDT